MDFIPVIKKYVDTVLQSASDPNKKSPLLADTIVIAENAPLRQKSGVTKSAAGYSEGKEKTGYEIISSNLVYQFQFLRTMLLLSRLTGDSSYENRVREIYQFHYDHLLMSSGRLVWGNHHDIDLLTLHDNGSVHELKCNYPDYDTMFCVDAQKTENAIRAFWRGHILNWNTLDLSRHAEEYDAYGKPTSTTDGLEGVFDHPYYHLPPFFKVEGLTFYNTASDLIYASLKLYEHTGNEKAMETAAHLYERYLTHRHPRTQLDSYLFGLNFENADEFMPTQIEVCGDRAIQQMWIDFGPGIYEGHLLNESTTNEIYGGGGQVMLLCNQWGGEIGKRMFESFSIGAHAYVEHAYDFDRNLFRGLLSDGTDLSDYHATNWGYFGGQPCPAFAPQSEQTLTYALTALQTEDSLMWNAVRNILRNADIGDIGALGGREPSLNDATSNADETNAALLVHLYYHSQNEKYLAAAESILKNAIAEQMEGNYFKLDSNPNYCGLSAATPFVALYLEAAKRGIAEIPVNIYHRILSSWRR